MTSARTPLIDPARALPWDLVPSHRSLSGDTVFIAAVDAQGNAAALINSLYGVFGDPSRTQTASRRARRRCTR